MHLLCLYVLLSIYFGSLAFKFKLFLVFHFLHYPLSVLIAQSIDILLLEFVDLDSLLNLPFLA
jgi:hypothetical protein